MSSLEYVKKVLADAERVVCLVGRGTTFQTGCQLYDGDFEYEIESRYGLSVEEIFSESYYNNRTREFFEFYREEVLKHCGEPQCGLSDAGEDGTGRQTDRYYFPEYFRTV